MSEIPWSRAASLFRTAISTDTIYPDIGRSGYDGTFGACIDLLNGLPAEQRSHYSIVFDEDGVELAPIDFAPLLNLRL